MIGRTIPIEGLLCFGTSFRLWKWKGNYATIYLTKTQFCMRCRPSWQNSLTTISQWYMDSTNTYESGTRKRNCQYYGTKLQQRWNANSHTVEQWYNGNNYWLLQERGRINETNYLYSIISQPTIISIRKKWGCNFEWVQYSMYQVLIDHLTLCWKWKALEARR